MIENYNHNQSQDRKWISDVLFTLKEAEVSALVKAAEAERTERIQQRDRSLFQTTDAIAEALRTSTFVSCKLTQQLIYIADNGRALSLLKAGAKPRRTREEVAEVQEAEDALREDR